MPEQQKNELVVWEEPIEKVHAEEIPNTGGFYHKEEEESNTGFYLLVGAIVTAGVFAIFKNRDAQKKRDEERKKNPTGSL